MTRPSWKSQAMLNRVHFQHFSVSYARWHHLKCGYTESWRPQPSIDCTPQLEHLILLILYAKWFDEVILLFLNINFEKKSILWPNMTNLEPSAHLQERVPCPDICGSHKFSGEDRWLIGQLRWWLVEKINQLLPGPEEFINTCSVKTILSYNTLNFYKLGR